MNSFFFHFSGLPGEPGIEGKEKTNFCFHSHKRAYVHFCLYICYRQHRQRFEMFLQIHYNSLSCSCIVGPPGLPGYQVCSFFIDLIFTTSAFLFKFQCENYYFLISRVHLEKKVIGAILVSKSLSMISIRMLDYYWILTSVMPNEAFTSKYITLNLLKWKTLISRSQSTI